MTEARRSVEIPDGESVWITFLSEGELRALTYDELVNSQSFDMVDIMDRARPGPTGPEGRDK